MKTIIMISILLLSFISASCLRENKRTPKIETKINAVIYMSKTEVGFNIYSNKGELILEYTKRNCDSLSLQTLDDIYETAKEFYNKERFEETSNSENTISFIRNISYAKQ